jgi:hypothetical protein
MCQREELAGGFGHFGELVSGHVHVLDLGAAAHTGVDKGV